VGAYATFVIFAWRDREEYEIGVDELRATERERRRPREAWLGLEPSA